jgi:hypothetical protein
MMSASECVRELLARIAAGVRVDERVKLKEDAEGVTAEFVGEDLGQVIGHHGGHEARRMDSPARGAGTRLLLGEALHEYAATRIRLSPWTTHR